jgi:threonine dehydrogenase-like Zn-dependent dehydrogenase
VVEIKTPDGEQSLALWYAKAGVVDLRPALAEAGPGQALVRMLWSGLSRGTERLIFTGRVPASEHERMRAPLQEGSFPFPVKYGYCAVGLVEACAEAPELVGRSVFCLHPHQTRFAAPIPMLTPLPDALPPRRAVLAANMETALNALWDSGAGPGDRIVVVGAGLVGLLVTYLAAGLPGADVTVVDLDASRQPIAESFGARFATPADFGSPGDADVVFHASAAAAGLGVALGAAALEARVVELSWYGEGDVPAPLGGAFHSRRLTLVSSQVGQVAPTRRPRWTYARRLAKALELLGDVRLEALITEDVAFLDLPQALPRLLAPGAKGLATVVGYGGAGGA